MTIFDDRREIGPATWLSEGLCFDVRANAICAIKRNVGFGSSLVKLWDDVTVRKAAGEPEVREEPSGKSEADQASREESPESLKRKVVRYRLETLYPKGDYTDIKTADLVRQINESEGWKAACKEFRVDPKGFTNANRDLLDRMLGRRPD